jgi:hypothetical protein
MKNRMVWALVAGVVGLVCTGIAAAPSEAPGPFLDVPAGHWALAAVNELASRGIVNGYPGGNYRGDRVMTRYQVAVAVQRVLQDPGHSDPPPRRWPETRILGPAPMDVPKDHWAADAVGQCRDYGIFAGYPEAVFAGERGMTRYELCFVLKRLNDWVLRFMQLGAKYGRQGSPPPLPADAPLPQLVWPPRPSRGPALKDVPRGHWAAGTVMFQRDWGIVAGYPGGIFDGDRRVTRYEFAQGLRRLFEFLDHTKLG